jgi:benzoyl-CoA reductase subunit C
MEMRTQDILLMCRRLITEPAYRQEYLRRIRGRTRGISAYLSNYIPEEIIAVTGFHPLRIIGRFETSGSQGWSLHAPVCSFARDMYAAADSGGFSSVSHVIFPNSCDSLRALREVWEIDRTLPPMYVLLHPIQADDHSVRYFAEQIESLARKLMEESGLCFTESQLADHIQRYNRSRQWLRELSPGAGGRPHLLRGSEWIILVTAGMIADRDEYNRMLQVIVAEDQETGPRSRDAGKRIMIIGPLVDSVELLETIERFGAMVVGEDITNGSRYCGLDVDLDGNLYENLAKRYLRWGPSPTMNMDIGQGDELFGRRLMDLNPDGVIFVTQKFCEPHVHNYLAKRHLLTRMNVNTLMLELEHNEAAVSAHDLLRVQAFIETLGTN